MGLVGLIFIVYALIVLFDILVQLLKNCNVVDLGKNDSTKKAVELCNKLTAPVYSKVTEVLPEKWRKLGEFETAPLLIFIVLSILGQMML
jgi:hypothetical protein